MRKIIVMCLAGIAIAACTQIDCPVQNTVFTVYNLKKADGTADSLNTDTMFVWSKRADGTDTVISRQIKGTLEMNYLYGDVTSFQLPISYTQPEDELYMLIIDAEGDFFLDTVRIKKENYPHFESVDCQAAYFHTVTAISTTHHFIDSITINNPEVTYDATNPHFYLYLKAKAKR